LQDLLRIARSQGFVTLVYDDEQAVTGVQITSKGKDFFLPVSAELNFASLLDDVARPRKLHPDLEVEVSIRSRSSSGDGAAPLAAPPHS
jgi:hypothetical protein